MSFRLVTLALVVLSCTTMLHAADMKPGDLNLVPFPKQVQLQEDLLALKPAMSLTVSDTLVGRQAADDLQQELKRAAKCACKADFAGAKPGLPAYWLFLRTSGMMPAEAKAALASAPANAEGYRLIVRRGYAAVGAREASGLVWGAQALIQLVRANMRGKSLPCLTIDDWPSLQYRGFMDDITRGPSATLGTLELEVRMSALFKMNIQNYYIEHQYAFSKYPDIGPKDGSLLPEELKKLVAYGKARNVDIIGNQQSFGHWATILENKKYAHLSENGWALNPMLDETYQMLDDMYAEQAPLTESKFFNVDCDEIGRLGPQARELAKQIGVGGVYAKHINRVHDILTKKYHKTMMMWGDIILRHPENLKDVPKDIVMLTWDYDDRVSYDDEVVAFEKNGFDYLVCPSTTCWSVLPDYGFAVDNIKGFVRDGAAHGTKGLLNTTWDDDAESFFGYYWHPIAWGAECAWNASQTNIDDFNRRIGPVLFGDRENHFGKGIEILMKTHKQGLNISTHRFWRTAKLPAAADRAKAVEDAKKLLDLVDPALKEFNLAKQDATANADQLDYVIFGAERMKCMCTRTLALIDAADLYAKASTASPETAKLLIQQATQKVQGIRDENARLKTAYQALWNREEKPYSLDWTLKKWDDLIAGYDKILTGLKSASTAADQGKPLPKAEEIGL